MNRITRQILSYINSINKQSKQIELSKLLKKEVNTGATGTQGYRIKKGPNKGKILNASK
tara:strand:+ start:510 stop:686 length:177 start_codon:yes stop_codon:yes gene_type:complete